VEIRDFSQLSKRASASLDGDSLREQEKSRISLMRNHAKVLDIQKV
ncbi:hypothetical protein HMPREF1586_01330, partial [Gardnerella vaginalis JCP8522]